MVVIYDNGFREITADSKNKAARSSSLRERPQIICAGGAIFPVSQNPAGFVHDELTQKLAYRLFSVMSVDLPKCYSDGTFSLWKIRMFADQK